MAIKNLKIQQNAVCRQMMISKSSQCNKDASIILYLKQAAIYVSSDKDPE
jgi:hypothetical protein